MLRIAWGGDFPPSGGPEMSTGQDKQELIAQAVSGNPRALQGLLLEYAPRLSRRISSKLPRSLQGLLDPEDVLNATFLQAFRGIKELRQTSEGAFSSWLKTIADNQLQDMLRALQRKKRGGGRRQVRGRQAGDASSVAELVELLSGREHLPDKSVARREAVHAVQVGIAALPDDQREAIRLHILEGRSLAETAAAMNRSPGAVRALVYRAKQDLREIMGSASVWLSAR